MADNANPDVQVEEPTPDSQPEVNQDSPAQDAPVDQPTDQPADQPEDDKADEPKPNRSQERIRDQIDRRKRAEAAASVAQREAEYWKEQALAKSKDDAKTDDMPGVTAEGIDPVEFAKGLKDSLLKELREEQGLTKAQAEVVAQEMEVSAQPEMKDEFFRKYVVSVAKADGLTPWEAFEDAKEHFAEIRKGDAKRVRDEAGKYVRESTQAPAAGRSSSGGSSVFTRKQIDDMTVDEYKKARPEIERQLASGLIK